jgi:chromate transporter
MQGGSKVHRAPLAPWTEVFMAFARIGLTSFGGGSATVSAMRQLCLRKRWLTEAQFIDQLVLSRLTPGISILSQVMLIGRAVCGPRGMVAGLAGLMLPSLTITIALAWGYERISAFPRAQVPLHAVAGMAAGFAVSLAIQLFRDIMRPVPFVRAFLLFVLFVVLGLWLGDPLLVMGIAITLALIFPDMFDMSPAPSEAEATDEP